MNPSKFLEIYVDALNKRNLDEILAMIAPQATFLFTEGNFNGHAEIAAALSKTFDLIKEEIYRIDNQHWIIVDKTTAACHYHFHWSGIIHGEQHSGSGRGTCILVKQEGKWQVCHEHLGPSART